MILRYVPSIAVWALAAVMQLAAVPGPAKHRAAGVLSHAPAVSRRHSSARRHLPEWLHLRSLAPAARLPRWWLAEAMCIHRHESINWQATTTWQGYPSPDRGGMQIAVSTWAAVAPKGYPAEPQSATPGQQLFVAYRIWLANGRRFGGDQWPLSSVACGLS